MVCLQGKIFFKWMKLGVPPFHETPHVVLNGKMRLKSPTVGSTVTNVCQGGHAFGDGVEVLLDALFQGWLLSLNPHPHRIHPSEWCHQWFFWDDHPYSGYRPKWLYDVIYQSIWGYTYYGYYVFIMFHIPKSLCPVAPNKGWKMSQCFTSPN